MSKLEAKVQQILNGEYIDDSSDDESVDIRALNERLDEEMIKQMQEEFDEDDEQEDGGCQDCCCDHTVIKPKRDLSFEAEWIAELKTLNSNYNISSTPEDISDANKYHLSILFNKGPHEFTDNEFFLYNLNFFAAKCNRAAFFPT